MAEQAGLTELRRGVLGPCVLALLDLRPRFGLELVRDLTAADGLLTSGGTRQVTSQLAGQATAQPNALKSDATSRLVLTSIVTLVLLISAALGRSLTRP